MKDEEKKKRVPKLRFPEYTDDWKQCKFDEFVTFYGGLTYSSGDIQKEGTLVLRSSNVNDGEVVSADDVFVNPNVVNSENVKEGDIIVVVRNGSRALIGKHAEIKGFMPNTVIGAFMTGIRSKHSSFVNALLNTPHFDEEVVVNMGATINQITGYMFSKMKFWIPSPEEQDAIGVFFKNLDYLIAVHKRKISNLKEMKKGLLQKMFPRDDEKTPVIRFPEFTDDWEQRKLGETVKSVDTGKSKFQSDSLKGDYAILGSTSVIGYDNSYDYEGDFILTARVGANAGSLYRYAGKVKISDNTVFIQAKANIDFIFYLLIKFDIKQLSFGTGQPLVKASELKNLDLKMPVNCGEQQKIGQYFRSLDKLITLHQRKISHLKELKKGLLQQMFV